MANILWFLLKPALVIIGTVTLLYPVLLLLCLVSGNSTFFINYLQGFFLIYDILLGICAAQAISSYAPLALSFGVTRRSLRKAVAVFFLALPLFCAVLDFLCNSATTRLLNVGVNNLFHYLVSFPLQGLGLKLLLCAAMLWLGTLPFGTMPLWQQILVILATVLVYLQITVFMFVASLIPDAILNVYSAVLGVLSVGLAAVAISRLNKLAITQN